MKMLPTLEMAKKKKTFYCKAKGLFCKVAKCAQKAQVCKTEKNVLRQNQVIEFDDIFLPVGH